MSRSFLYPLLAALALPASLLASGCAECGCEISTSSTDREARWARMRAIEEYNRPFESYADWNEAEARRLAEYKGYEERYNARFHGLIIPGMGCDVCEEACAIWDLRPMDTSEYKVHFREASRLMLRARNREEAYVGDVENRRLECVVAAHPERLLEALKELMHPREHSAVRSDAMAIAVSRGLDRAYTLMMLEDLNKEDSWYGIEARDMLEEMHDADAPDAPVE